MRPTAVNLLMDTAHGRAALLDMLLSFGVFADGPNDPHELLIFEGHRRAGVHLLSEALAHPKAATMFADWIALNNSGEDNHDNA